LIGEIREAIELKIAEKPLRFTTKELALISVLSSLWIVSEIYLGPVISQTIQVHGVVQRLFGWFLMLIMARLTGKFGRITMMSIIASLATRIIRPGQLYSLFVGLGYALGGLIFDSLYFVPNSKKTKGDTTRIYLLIISAISGLAATIPYQFFKLYTLGYYGYLIWVPLYSYDMAKGVALSVLGTMIGISLLPQIDIWTPKISGSKRQIPMRGSHKGAAAHNIEVYSEWNYRWIALQRSKIQDTNT